METICVLIRKECSLPVRSDVNILPVYTCETAFSPSAVPCGLNGISEGRPYGLLLDSIFHEGELADLSELLKSSLVKEAREVSFADPSVLYASDPALRKKLIYRPETLLACTKDAQFWKDTGILGVSLSPVITRKETETILSEVKGCEVMIHGHQLLSVSARKLLTAYQESTHLSFDPHSENLFLEEETRKEKMPVTETARETAVYSGMELETFDLIRGFQSAGAMQYFIQGRFMKEEDLHAVIGIYADLVTGKDCREDIAQYRRSHPQCTEGFYAERTIL